jgi:uncharacterized protein (DUF58 family)
MEIPRRIGEMLPHEGRLLLAAVLLLLVPGWVKGINLLMLLAFLLLGLWVVNWVAARRQIGRLSGARRWRGPLFAGAESQWDVEVRNERDRPSVAFRVRDQGPHHLQERFLNRIEPRQNLRMASRVVLPHRGIYRLGPLSAVCLYPFGLARHSRLLAAGEDVLVLPQMGRLDLAGFQRWLARITRGDGRLHRLARPSMIHQDDLHGMRPFRPGDNPRWIHWRTSARRNLKMVREFEEDAGQNLIVIVEPWSVSHEHADPAVEATISLAATICWEWCRQSTEYLMLAVAGHSPAVAAGYSSRDTALQMLRHLAKTVGEATIEPTPLLKAVAAEVVPEAPVLIISPRADSPLVARLARAWNRPVAVLVPLAAADFYDPPVPVASAAPSPAANQLLA